MITLCASLLDGLDILRPVLRQMTVENRQEQHATIDGLCSATLNSLDLHMSTRHSQQYIITTCINVTVGNIDIAHALSSSSPLFSVQSCPMDFGLQNFS